jgi:hypothetical protein
MVVFLQHLEEAAATAAAAAAAAHYYEWRQSIWVDAGLSDEALASYTSTVLAPEAQLVDSQEQVTSFGTLFGCHAAAAAAAGARQ